MLLTAKTTVYITSEEATSEMSFLDLWNAIKGGLDLNDVEITTDPEESRALDRKRLARQEVQHPCDPSRGIVVTSEKSRVTYLAHLDHRPIHPTPLYSIAYNLIIGPLLLRFWTIPLPLPFIIGMYLVLGGMGRFVEEAYRGVPHTQRFYRLSIYQWLSVAGIATGAALTTVRGPDYSHSINWLPIAFPYAAVFGLFAAFALSTDFPKSSRRFSRLAPP